MSWSPLRLDIDGPIAVACSGGADSVALADHLRSERGAAAITLVHVDHGLRPDSAADGERVRELAARLGTRARVVRVQVEPGASLERAARDARHAALERAADELGARWIALGHTASDQAETVLMRVVRGTGIAGLAAMAPVRGRLVRPLLSVTRADTEAYCRRRGLPFCRDPMNADERFARVRARRRHLPALAAENPSLEAALCRLAEAAREHRELLDAAADAIAANPAAPLCAAALASAPAAAAKHALARAAAAAGLGMLEADHLAAALELARGPDRGSLGLDLPGGRLVREYGQLRFQAGAPSAPPALSVDGPYDIRPWRPGDRMRPARLRGRSRKLSDLYADAKVPRRLRDGARVVVRRADGEIVWAEHLGPAAGGAPAVFLTPPKPMSTNGN